MTTITATATSANLNDMMSIITLSSGSKEATSSRPVPRKKVSFAATARMRLCLHRKDYSLQERHACWYSQQEEAKIRAEIRETAMWMQAGCISQVSGSNDLERCINMMGVEFRTPSARRHVAGIRNRAWDAVFKEQRKHQQQRNADTSTTTTSLGEAFHSSRYRKISMECQLVANQRALLSRWLGETSTVTTDYFLS